MRGVGRIENSWWDDHPSACNTKCGRRKLQRVGSGSGRRGTEKENIWVLKHITEFSSEISLKTHQRGKKQLLRERTPRVMLQREDGSGPNRFHPKKQTDAGTRRRLRLTLSRKRELHPRTTEGRGEMCASVLLHHKCNCETRETEQWEAIAEKKIPPW